jgi:hypothetical protein
VRIAVPDQELKERPAQHRQLGLGLIARQRTKAEQALEAHAIPDIAYRRLLSEIALVLETDGQVASLAGVNHVPPVDAHRFALPLHDAVETAHDEYRPGRTQQLDFRRRQTNAARERHAEVFVYCEMGQFRVAEVGLEKMGRRQAWPFHQEQPSTVFNGGIEVDQQLVLHARDRHAHLAIPYRKWGIAVCDARVQFRNGDFPHFAPGRGVRKGELPILKT